MKHALRAMFGLVTILAIIGCANGSTDSGKNPAKYSVTYDGNGNTGGTAPAEQVKTEEVDLELDANSGSLVRKYYAFAGWNTAADGAGTDYAAGATYTGNTDLKLYAKWTMSLKIGFAYPLKTDIDPWHATQCDSVKKAISGKNYTIVFSDANTDQANQIAAIRDFIAKDVDVIFMAPIALTGWTDVLGEAKAAGIPVVLLGDVITGDETLYAAAVVYDCEAEGRKAAEALVALKGTETVTILEIEGPNGDQAATKRKKGFDAEVAKHSSYNIVKSVAVPSWSRNTAKTETTTAFTDISGITVVYAHNDLMALGAIDAIKIKGSGLGTGAGQITVLGNDCMKVGLQAVLDGDMYASVECSPFLGQTAVETCEKLLAGTLKDKTIYMNDLVYKKTDLTQAFVDAREY